MAGGRIGLGTEGDRIGLGSERSAWRACYSFKEPLQKVTKNSWF